jgi:hypothetical protein
VLEFAVVITVLMGGVYDSFVVLMFHFVISCTQPMVLPVNLDAKSASAA